MEVAQDDPSSCFIKQVSELQALQPFLDKSIGKLSSDEESPGPSKPVSKNVPVFHTFLIKEIKESESGPLLVGTFIQRTYGVDDGQPFSYRLNEDTASSYIEHRRTETHQVSFMGRTIPMTRTLYIAKIPLLLDEEFDGFPFTLIRATADIELSSRSTLDGKVVYKPNLMIHEEERRHNVCLQDAKWALGMPGESPENRLKRKMDKLRLYDFISPYPEVSYLFEEKNFYCPRFRVSFLIEEEGFPKFIQTQLPMLLLAILASINLWIDVLDDDTGLNRASRYVGISATLALNLVFLLPTMFRARKTHVNYNVNDLNVIMIFLSLCMLAIPPGIGSTGLAYTALALLWASFAIPLSNFLTFELKKRAIEARHDAFIKRSKNNPFVKDASHQEKKASSELSGLRDISTFLPEVGESKSKDWHVTTFGANSTSKTHILSYFKL